MGKSRLFLQIAWIRPTDLRLIRKNELYLNFWSRRPKFQPNLKLFANLEDFKKHVKDIERSVYLSSVTLTLADATFLIQKQVLTQFLSLWITLRCNVLENLEKMFFSVADFSTHVHGKVLNCNLHSPFIWKFVHVY